MAVQVDASDRRAPEGRLDDRDELELQLLLEGVYRQYGFDFREYAPASLKRRVWRRVDAEKAGTITGLLERVLHDPDVMERLLLDLSINVTSMFRDPTFYARVPRRRSCRCCARIRSRGSGSPAARRARRSTRWRSCSHEEGVYDRTRIYATDINEAVLERARAGVFPLDKMQEYTRELHPRRRQALVLRVLHREVRRGALRRGR